MKAFVTQNKMKILFIAYIPEDQYYLVNVDGQHFVVDVPDKSCVKCLSPEHAYKWETGWIYAMNLSVDVQEIIRQIIENRKEGKRNR